MEDFRACAYSYLYEKSTMCDYEIATDELASMIAQAQHDLRFVDIRILVEWVYHANGSLRGKMAITTEIFDEMSRWYDDVQKEVGVCKDFVLPQGSYGATNLHVLRSYTKKIIRLLHFVETEEGLKKNQLLHDFFNLLSNLFFVLARQENKGNEVDEIVFHSKSYGY